MFFSKLRFGEQEIKVTAPVFPLSLLYGIAFGTFLGILVFTLVHGKSFPALIVALLLSCCFWAVIMLPAEMILRRTRRCGLIINASGITRLGKKGDAILTLTWNEIKDYGFSCNGGFFITQHYCLYFACSELTKSIKDSFVNPEGCYTDIGFDKRTYLRKGADILAFCAQFTDVEPFIADSKKHTNRL